MVLLLTPSLTIVSYVLDTMSLFGNIVITKSAFFATSLGLELTFAPLALSALHAGADTSYTFNLCPWRIRNERTQGQFKYWKSKRFFSLFILIVS